MPTTSWSSSSPARNSRNPSGAAAAKLADDVRGVHEDLVVDGQDRDRSLPGEAYHLIPPINVSVHHLVVQLQPLKLFLDDPAVRAVIACVQFYLSRLAQRRIHESLLILLIIFISEQTDFKP